MGDFRTYGDVEHYGKPETENILKGVVRAKPKLDGQNARIRRLPNGELQVGSRKQVINGVGALNGFWLHVQETPAYAEYLELHPTHILFGEWLVELSIHYYQKDKLRQFYVFDVYDTATETFLDHYDWAEQLVAMGINVVPVVREWLDPTIEELQEFSANLYYFVDPESDPETCRGEGIVIHNPNFVSRYGDKNVRAKIMNATFTNRGNAKGSKSVKERIRPQVSNQEDELVNSIPFYDETIEKEWNKALQIEPDMSKAIPIVLNEMWRLFWKEEFFNLVEQRKTGRFYGQWDLNIDDLKGAVIKRTKKTLQEIYNRDEQTT